MGKADLLTVYNTLHQFTEAGLFLRQVAIDSSRSYFDTNNTEHTTTIIWKIDTSWWTTC